MAVDSLENRLWFIPVAVVVLVWIGFYCMVAYFAAGFTFMDRIWKGQRVVGVPLP